MIHTDEPHFWDQIDLPPAPRNGESCGQNRFEDPTNLVQWVCGGRGGRSVGICGQVCYLHPPLRMLP